MLGHSLHYFQLFGGERRAESFPTQQHLPLLNHIITEDGGITPITTRGKQTLQLSCLQFRCLFPPVLPNVSITFLGRKPLSSQPVQRQGKARLASGLASQPCVWQHVPPGTRQWDACNSPASDPSPLPSSILGVVTSSWYKEGILRFSALGGR